jgi:hypothetical protein
MDSTASVDHETTLQAHATQIDGHRSCALGIHTARYAVAISKPFIASGTVGLEISFSLLSSSHLLLKRMIIQESSRPGMEMSRTHAHVLNIYKQNKSLLNCQLVHMNGHIGSLLVQVTNSLLNPTYILL